MKITKAKLTKEQTVEKIGFIETNDDESKKTVENAKGDWIAHQDLVEAFNRLTPHLILLCEQPEASSIDVDNIESISTVPGYTVSSFTIAGEEEDEGFTISGTRLLNSGKVLPLNTPFQKWDDAAPYEYISEVGEVISSLQYHVEQYLEGKRAPKRQLEMVFEENLDPVDPDDLDLHDEGVEMKKKAKKKKAVKV